ncbi:hypothetical protein [Pedobacter endophyticus]|uniref:hypothetical protein n=1 Tax=Pedobacter endophyticus TaxID=2789740 RepID=UPI001E5697AA|nr:hypothetical protein [Pedobacter endophyticus]
MPKQKINAKKQVFISYEDRQSTQRKRICLRCCQKKPRLNGEADGLFGLVIFLFIHGMNTWHVGYIHPMSTLLSYSSDEYMSRSKEC